MGCLSTPGGQYHIFDWRAFYESFAGQAQSKTYRFDRPSPPRNTDHLLGRSRITLGAYSMQGSRGRIQCCFRMLIFTVCDHFWQS